jgi:hypothetical protein
MLKIMKEQSNFLAPTVAASSVSNQTKPNQKVQMQLYLLTTKQTKKIMFQ